MTVNPKMNQDLREERQKVTFNVEEFTNWYHGGVENVKDKRYLGKWISDQVEGLITWVNGGTDLGKFPYESLVNW